jgi:hypothetical protein
LSCTRVRSRFVIDGLLYFARHLHEKWCSEGVRWLVFYRNVCTQQVLNGVYIAKRVSPKDGMPDTLHLVKHYSFGDSLTC